MRTQIINHNDKYICSVLHLKRKIKRKIFTIKIITKLHMSIPKLKRKENHRKYTNDQLTASRDCSTTKTSFWASPSSHPRWTLHQSSSSASRSLQITKEELDSSPRHTAEMSIENDDDLSENGDVSNYRSTIDDDRQTARSLTKVIVDWVSICATEEGLSLLSWHVLVLRLTWISI